MVDKLRYILLKTIFQGANFFGKSFVFPLLQTPPLPFSFCICKGRELKPMLAAELYFADLVLAL